MPTSSFLFPVLYLLISISITNGAQLILVNNCNESIWPGILGSAGVDTPQSGGFHLGSGEESVLDAPEKWSGRIWGRQGCSFDSNGKGNCETGDCFGQLHCQGKGGVPPATVVEMTLGTSTSPLHFYDVSLVDGFNLPVSMRPVGGGIGCGVASCEDVATKIMAFSQQGPRAVCVLSANGAVSTVTLRQPSTSGGTVTYEGRFEIVCLSGSYLLTEIGSSRNRSGGLSVSLASPDGRVIGGGVGGMLIAATPVQVILGSFTWGGLKTKNKKKEAVEGVTDMEHETVDNSVALNSIQPDQSLSQSASLAVWQASQPLDMHNSHVDIDLMRG